MSSLARLGCLLTVVGLCSVVQALPSRVQRRIVPWPPSVQRGCLAYRHSPWPVFLAADGSTSQPGQRITCSPRFYMCDRGREVVIECPVPLVFDPRINGCNWPGEVNCFYGFNSGNSLVSRQDVDETKSVASSTQAVSIEKDESVEMALKVEIPEVIRAGTALGEENNVFETEVTTATTVDTGDTETTTTTVDTVDTETTATTVDTVDTETTATTVDTVDTETTATTVDTVDTSSTTTTTKIPEVSVDTTVVTENNNILNTTVVTENSNIPNTTGVTENSNIVGTTLVTETSNNVDTTAVTENFNSVDSTVVTENSYTRDTTVVNEKSNIANTTAVTDRTENIKIVGTTVDHETSETSESYNNMGLLDDNTESFYSLNFYEGSGLDQSSPITTVQNVPQDENQGPNLDASMDVVGDDVFQFNYFVEVDTDSSVSATPSALGIKEERHSVSKVEENSAEPVDYPTGKLPALSLPESSDELTAARSPLIVSLAPRLFVEEEISTEVIPVVSERKMLNTAALLHGVIIPGSDFGSSAAAPEHSTSVKYSVVPSTESQNSRVNIFQFFPSLDENSLETENYATESSVVDNRPKLRDLIIRRPKLN